jgi:1-acyl-sn-glycerol-3-phosphate acyltransferase
MAESLGKYELASYQWLNYDLAEEEHFMSQDKRSQTQYFTHRTIVSRVWFFFFAIYVFLFMRLKVIGLENLPQKNGFILSSNHLEQVDSFLLVHVIPKPVFFMAKADIFANPVSSYICRHLGAFPINRGKIDRWGLQHALEILSDGRILGVYPEGERSKTKAMEKGKNGPAYLAIKGNAPIVPVAIVGTNRMFEKLLRRTAITIQVGKPLYRRDGETVYELTDRLMHSIAAMLPVQMRGVYS